MITELEKVESVVKAILLSSMMNSIGMAPDKTTILALRLLCRLGEQDKDLTAEQIEQEFEFLVTEIER